MMCEDVISETPSPGRAKRLLTYNLFRRKLEPDLYCAVPEDCPVPGFLTHDGWVFGGTVTAIEAAMLGFQEEAAWHGVALNGFYLFLYVSNRIRSALELPCSRPRRPVSAVSERTPVPAGRLLPGRSIGARWAAPTDGFASPRRSAGS